MTSMLATHFVRTVHAATRREGLCELADNELLRRFAAEQDEEAFGILVKRHGRLVMGACLRVLKCHHDAEDACQAIFLVLARKAGSLSWQDTVSGWLYRVACQVALNIRTATARRRTRDLPEEEAMPATNPRPADSDQGAAAILDEEINRLPEKERAALLLCCLEQKSRQEATRILGWNPKHCLESARNRLRGRLARRGIVVSAVSLGVLLRANGAPALPISFRFLHATVRAASLSAKGLLVPGVVPAQVVRVVTEVLKTMSLNKVKLLLSMFVATSIALATTCSAWTYDRPTKAAALSGLLTPDDVETPGNADRTKLDNAVALVAVTVTYSASHQKLTYVYSTGRVLVLKPAKYVGIKNGYYFFDLGNDAFAQSRKVNFVP